ncbi:MAG: PLP-dependent aspartate aminotransferase family protein [Nitrospiraceae bacterium]|nr:PLP-dependent aspartate aminotransferase family protein [Nitrospiraceae bacterium]
MKKDTECVHGGEIFDEATGGMNTPIYPSSAFEYRGRKDVPYPRYFNTPNQRAIIEKLCILEGAEDGVLFGSGMAAISTTLCAFAGAGDHVVMMDELYGGTHAFATDTFARLGIAHSFAATSAEAVCAAIRKDTKVVTIESPTNPLLSVIDIRKVAACCREKGAVSVIDNTFAGPILQNPLALGIDVVVHSGTKYLGGHSDLCFGVAVSSKEKIMKILALARHFGGTVNAQTCYLIERSLKTLALRMERQTENAGKIAGYLSTRKDVTKVFYPGLAGSAGHSIARTQMSGFGAMLSFELDARNAKPDEFLRRLMLIRPAVSLGGIETTICSPAKTSHAKMSAEERQRIGVTDGLLRLSVGIEHVDDLIGDLGQALG